MQMDVASQEAVGYYDSFFCSLWQVLKETFVEEPRHIRMCVGNSFGCEGLRILIENCFCRNGAWGLRHDSCYGIEEVFKQRQAPWF